MKPIVESLFSELTLLGFIGLTLFLVFKMEWLKDLSKDLYGEENEITELGEAVHMVLFLIMVIFLCQAVLMAQMGERILNKWRTWEQRKIESFSPEAIVEVKRLCNCSFLELSFISGLRDHTRILLHALTRDRFIAVHGLNPADFEFASYLGIALGKTLAEIVEVPVKTWLQLEVILLIFWQVDNVMDRSMRFVFWVCMGYTILIASYLTHAKLRMILLEHAAPLIEKAEARGGGEGLLRSNKLLPPRRTRSAPIKDSPTKKRTSMKPQVMRAQTTKALFGDRILEDSDDDDEEKTDPGGGGAPPAPDGYQTIDMPPSFRNGNTEEDATTCSSMKGAFWRNGLVAFLLDCYRAVKPAQSAAVRHRKRMSVAMAPGVDPAYQNKFWYGDHHKAHFTLDIVRTIPLGMAIYIAVLALVYCPQLFTKQVFKPFHWVFRIVFLAIAAVPPFACQYKLPRIVQDRAGKGCEIPNFEGSYLGRFPLVLADFWTGDHLSERSRSVDAFSGTSARGTLTLKRR